MTALCHPSTCPLRLCLSCLNSYASASMGSSTARHSRILSICLHCQLVAQDSPRPCPASPTLMQCMFFYRPWYRHSPSDGGTLLTLIGLGFVDLGATVGFADDSGNVTLAPATLAYGDFRGRVLTCYSPPAGHNTTVMRIELSLNGARLPPAMTTVSSLRFSYYPVPGSYRGDVENFSGGAGSSTNVSVGNSSGSNINGSNISVSSVSGSNVSGSSGRSAWF